MKKLFSYFDHDADIGIIGRGDSLENAFINSAVAVFAIMQNPKKITPKTSVTVEFTESDSELALVEWLNALIAAAREHGMVFCKFELSHINDHWLGKAWGEPWGDNVSRGVEVKGATLTMLSIKQFDDSSWEAKCVVDV